MNFDWNELNWGSLITLECGKLLKGYKEGNGDYRVFGTNEAIGWTNKYLSDGLSIVMGRKGAYRRVNYSEDMIDTAFYIDLKKEADLFFYYYLLNTLGLDDMNTNTAVPGLNRNIAYRIQVRKFPEKLMKKLADITADSHKMMRVKKLEKNTLENLIHTLLPKWISGEDGV